VADHAVIRALVVMAIAFVAGALLYPLLISALVRRNIGQRVARYGPTTHRIKEGTPTLGGVLFVALAVLAWIIGDRTRTGFVPVFALLAGAVIGGIDDLVNVRSGNELGLPAWHRLAIEGVAGVLVGLGVLITGFTQQYFPGLGAPDLHWGVVIVVALAVVATSNAVNLTDGVDGLAASCAGIVFFGVALIAVHTGNVPVTVLAAALTGSVAAFLVYNWHPARLFMGDTGSLALGAALVALTAEVHLLWLLPLLGIVFVVETLSVVINVTAIRRFGHRIFRASPLHHHFEELGLREQRLVAAFATAAAVGTVVTVLYARAAGPL
jgi:phospho-N-acetylmuramoyl-pentapeptide-transferase